MVVKGTTLLMVSLILLGTQSTKATGQAPDPDPTRYVDDIARFQAWDRQNAVPENGIVFVGSSSIVRWNTAERFPELPVINRGFGGSHISDVNHYIEDTVLRYEPALIVFYAGNNDIQSGKTPEQVLDDYREFVERTHARLPETRILFISIGPSPSRWARWPAMREANALIERFTATDARLFYVDISPGILRDRGEPDASLFVEDRLHLNEAGYDAWQPFVKEAIEAALAAPVR